MIHPHTELRYINDVVGYGVVATQFIPKGTITWAMDKLDRVFTSQEVYSMEEMYQEIIEKYTYRNNKGNFILCWDHARFVNHSFDSNCITTAYEFEIAVRDIHPGEELTDDYGYLNISEAFDAAPEPGTTRSRVMPDDLLRYHHVWDAKLLDAFRDFNSVDQPLKRVLGRELFEKAQRIGKGEEKMDSILTCYYDQGKEKRKAG
jgi:uncharacterized protein